MNDISRFQNGGLPAEAAAMANRLASLQHESPPLSSEPLLRLMKSGEWVFGPDDADVDEGTRMAIDLSSWGHGYCCWIDSKLEGEVMVPIDRPLPDPETLDDLGEPWKLQFWLVGAFLTGPDKGQIVRYKVSSKSGRDTFVKMAATIGEQMQSNPGKLPIVELGISSYQHKKHGRIYTPMLEVVGWMDDRADAEPEPEAKPEPTQPRRRRRRE